MEPDKVVFIHEKINIIKAGPRYEYVRSILKDAVIYVVDLAEQAAYRYMEGEFKLIA